MKYLVVVKQKTEIYKLYTYFFFIFYFLHISFVVKIAIWMLAEYEGSIYIRQMNKVNIEIARSSEICTLGSYLGSP